MEANGTVISRKKLSVEFPKCEPFNGKSWKLREHNQMEGKFPVTNLVNLAIVVYFSGNSGKC